ncbi:hypothetical protein BDN72DRAFT_841351 [Pluteus cervinus]|uniref:Uncharacterized protein n=1 Tax=Pluteus cervinus TaxID=181527 RepID=A0ACD3AUZ3_9AGAR|nr:hypothetical protein BDN72DRAFT_841351 [Pluteus cervinus]
MSNPPWQATLSVTIRPEQLGVTSEAETEQRNPQWQAVISVAIRREQLRASLEDVQRDDISLHKLGAHIDVLVDFVLAHANEAGTSYTNAQLELLSAVIADVETFTRRYGRQGRLSRCFHQARNNGAVLDYRSQLTKLCGMDPVRRTVNSDIAFLSHWIGAVPQPHKAYPKN